jgi:hypothetical protein
VWLLPECPGQRAVNEAETLSLDFAFVFVVRPATVRAFALGADTMPALNSWRV